MENVTCKERKYAMLNWGSTGRDLASFKVDYRRRYKQPPVKPFVMFANSVCRHMAWAVCVFCELLKITKEYYLACLFYFILFFLKSYSTLFLFWPFLLTEKGFDETFTKCYISLLCAILYVNVGGFLCVSIKYMNNIWKPLAEFHSSLFFLSWPWEKKTYIRTSSNGLHTVFCT